MKRIWSLILLLILFAATTAFEISAYFDDEYKQAMDIYKENSMLLKSQCSMNVKFEICSSIVFPEFIRYSEFKDFLETEALKASYVMMGSDIVDFSIGYCQMKPSFIEKLEEYVWNSDSLQENFKELLIYNDTSLKEIRRERIERLENPEWQFRYLSCFYEIMQELTNEFEWEGYEDKIRYYSTAYNFNFLAPRKDIQNMYGKKYFPYGPKYKGSQYAYYEIAIQFYKLKFKK